MAMKRTTAKKATGKKPMIKRGSVKKPLRKAQYGDRVYSGPLNKSDIERLDKGYPSTAPVAIPQAPKKPNLIRGFNPFVNGQMVSNEEREAMERKDSENYMRRPKRLKKGGPMKSTTKTSLTKAQDGKIIKSKKVRKVDLNSFGPSSASVSKTNRKGTTVTKSVNTSQGYVPTASMTKSITDKQGNTTSKTKDIGWNKALKKQNRITKKVGRNANDEWSIGYKTGGATKPIGKKMQDGGPTGVQNIRRKILTKRINNLNDKGIENQIAGNKEKALKQFDKSDKLHQRRSDIRKKAGYKKGGAIKAKRKK